MDLVLFAREIIFQHDSTMTTMEAHNVDEIAPKRIITRVKTVAECKNVKVLSQCGNHQKRNDGER
jgi:hypothetical protein